MQINSYGKEARLKGIRKATNAGKLKGKKPLSYEDCPDFVSLYESYRHRGMTKGELADRLNVSRPTPDKLILQYKGEKDKMKKNIKRTSFDLTIENSEALNQCSQRMKMNYSQLLNAILKIIFVDRGEIQNKVLQESLKHTSSMFLDMVRNEDDPLRIMAEYADLKHDLDFLCKLAGAETSSDIGHR